MSRTTTRRARTESAAGEQSPRERKRDSFPHLATQEELQNVDPGGRNQDLRPGFLRLLHTLSSLVTRR